MKKHRTQKERIIDYLEKKKYITALDGFTKFNPPITQIHTVIHNLRNDGYEIECEMVKNKNTGTYFAKWTLNR